MNPGEVSGALREACHSSFSLRLRDLGLRCSNSFLGFPFARLPPDGTGGASGVAGAVGAGGRATFPSLSSLMNGFFLVRRTARVSALQSMR